MDIFVATEKTWFDDWLKDKLCRDIIFRVALWISISITAMYFSIYQDAVSIHGYFKNTSNSLVRLANSVGTISIVLGIVALMFKDLEFLESQKYGQHKKVGKVGGILRRLAGDLTLWTLGLLVTFLCIVTIAGYKATGNMTEVVVFTLAYVLLLFMAIGVACFNIFIRRANPSPFVNVFKKPWIAFVCYSLIIVVVIYVAFFLGV